MVDLHFQDKLWFRAFGFCDLCHKFVNIQTRGPKEWPRNQSLVHVTMAWSQSHFESSMRCAAVEGLFVQRRWEKDRKRQKKMSKDHTSQHPIRWRGGKVVSLSLFLSFSLSLSPFLRVYVYMSVSTTSHILHSCFNVDIGGGKKLKRNRTEQNKSYLELGL